MKRTTEMNVTSRLLLTRHLLFRGLLSVLLVAPASAVFGDILELKNGSLLKGTYAGGTAGTIRFETTAGLQVISRSEALALTFTSTPLTVTTGQAPARPAPAAATQSAAPAATTMTMPSGTLLLVRMETKVSSRDKPGRKFAAKLEANLVAAGSVVAKAGTKVYGRVEAGR
jgi:hypothetical protein